MSISILICTRNRPDDIARCLAALAASDLAHVGEIVVLDQSAQPLAAAQLPHELARQLRYAWRPGRGLARARNQALLLASGELIAFIDDDCLVTPTWANQIERAFREQPQLDGVFGRVLAYGDQGAITYHQFKTAFGEIAYATRPPADTCNALFTKQAPAAFNRPIMTLENLGSGNNMTFRRSVFERYGGFLEMLGAGTWLHAGEDVEFHYRLLQHHRTLAYQPGILLYHNRWLAPRENEPLQHGYTTGMIATYLYLGLRGDRYAWNYFKYRFGTVTQEVASRPEPGAARKPRRFYAERAAAFAKGLLGGAWLALTQRPRPIAAPAASDKPNRL